MKAKLLMLALSLSSSRPGTYFYDWGTGVRTSIAEAPATGLETFAKSYCTAAACNATQCLQAENILTDAGRPDCNLYYISCPIRLGTRARAAAVDAGVTFTAARYQQVRLIAMRCPTTGGFGVGVPVDAAGWPVFATASVAHPCAWKPSAGATCSRVNPDGGAALSVAPELTMQAGEWVGAGCVRKACVEVAGESSAP